MLLAWYNEKIQGEHQEAASVAAISHSTLWTMPTSSMATRQRSDRLDTALKASLFAPKITYDDTESVDIEGEDDDIDDNDSCHDHERYEHAQTSSIAAHGSSSRQTTTNLFGHPPNQAGR